MLAIYKVTKLFPPSEQFALINQLHRAVISITSNVAEGFSRHSSRDKNQFYRIALGSLTEVQNQLLLARDIGYLSAEDFNVIAQQTVMVSKMINGLIKRFGMVDRNT